MHRLRTVVVCLLALGLGVAAGACGLLRGCPEVEPFHRSVYEVDQSDERPELAGAVVDATEDEVSLSYTLERLEKVVASAGG